MKKLRVVSIVIFCTILLLFGAGVSLRGASDSAFAVEFASESNTQGIKADAPANLEELQAATDEQLNAWTKLPKFDGRDYGYVTRARNQGGKLICWAYTAIGAVEANILRGGIDPTATKDNLDLDEIAAAYVRYNRDGTHDPLNLTTNDIYFDAWNQGAHADEAFLAMSQGYSPINQTASDVSSDDYIKDALSESKYFIKGYTLIPKNAEAIKRAILQYGAVTIEYKSPNYTWQNYLYYEDGSSLGHASLIIGWDDNVSSSKFSPNDPHADGAWIVKNSWGPSGIEVNGTYCFYLSYNSYLGDSIYSVDTALKNDYPNLYYYDGHITDNGTKYITEAHGAIYEAKLSSSSVRERLKAVVFGFHNQKLTATISVYKHVTVNPGNVNDPANNPTRGELVATKEVYFENEGLYTVDLDTPVYLEQGEYFSVVISGVDSDGEPLYPFYGFDGNDSVNDMTYRMYGGEWTSMKYSGYYADTSFYSMCTRIRAVTDTVPREEPLGNDLKYARVEIADRLLYYVKGQPQIPDIKVYMGDKKLTPQQDYTITLLNNDVPGQATVIVSGQNGYFGKRTSSFEVAKPKYPPGALRGVINVYNNVTRLHDIPIPQDWIWIDGDITLESGESYFQYSLRYIGDDADCYQTKTCNFKVNKINSDPPDRTNISTATVEIDGEYIYTGSQIVPMVKVIYNGLQLNAGIDYEMSCRDNINAGQAVIVISGKGQYIGELSRTFVIGKANCPKLLPDSVLSASRRSQTLGDVPLNCADWYWKDPSLQIGERLTAIAVYKGKDKDNYNITELSITVIKNGKQNIAQITEILLAQTQFVYDGTPKTPDVVAEDGDVILVKGKDFEVEYDNNVNAGSTATVTITGINNYDGSVTLTFMINRADRNSFAVTQRGWTYGDNDIPQPNVTEVGENAPVSYSYSTQANGPFSSEMPSAAGTYWIRAHVETSQNYNAAVSVAMFTIARKNMGDFAVMIQEELTYTGEELRPEVSVFDGQTELLQNTDFSVRYDNNTNAGNAATVTIYGIGNYMGQIVRNFTIAKAKSINISTTIRVDGVFESLAEVPLPQDFVWDEQSFVTLTDGVFRATAIYVGGNYDIDKIEFEIIVEIRPDVPNVPNDPFAPDKPNDSQRPDLPESQEPAEKPRNELLWLAVVLPVAAVAVVGVIVIAVLYKRKKRRDKRGI